MHSQKLIQKLTEEYTRLISEYKSLDENNKHLEQTNTNNQKVFDTFTKSQSNLERTLKLNASLKLENDKLRKEVAFYKDNYTLKMNANTKQEKELKDKEALINELKASGNKFTTMLKERDTLIQSYNNKVTELSNAIEQKDQQIRMIIQFSKELNQENKTNVQEITKQAVKTIKIFYNTLNNNNNNSDKNNNCNYNNISTCEDDFSDFSPKQCHILLTSQTNNDNLKHMLTKSEFFSSLLREMQFVSHLQQITSQLTPFTNKITPQYLLLNAANIKQCLTQLTKERDILVQENETLKTKVTETELYITKLRQDLRNKALQMRKELVIIDEAYQRNINALKNELAVRSKEQATEDKNVHHNQQNEIEKIKEINLNLNKAIQERDNVIGELQQRNEMLMNEISTLKIKVNEHEKQKLIKQAGMEGNDYIQVIPLVNNLTQHVQHDNNSSNNSRIDDYRKPHIRHNNLYKVQNITNFTYNYNKKVINERLYENNKRKECVERSVQVENIMNTNVNTNLNTHTNNEAPVCDTCAYYNSLISTFLSSTPHNTFSHLTQAYSSLPNELSSLSQLLNDITTKLNQTQSNFVSSWNCDKKVKSSQLLEILSQVEKLLTYLSSNISKSNFTISSFTQHLQNIFSFVNNLTSSTTHINNTPSPTLSELKQFFNINDKVFSSAELRKYTAIYAHLSINDVVTTFEENCNDIKQALCKVDDDKYSDTSEYGEHTIHCGSSGTVLNRSNVGEANAYRIVNEKILSLKKFEFNYNILMELVKNYLVAMEIVVNAVQRESEEKLHPNSGETPEKQNLGNAMNALFCIFEESVNFKIDEMEDDMIFNRRVLMKLMHNYKEYVFIAYDI